MNHVSCPSYTIRERQVLVDHIATLRQHLEFRSNGAALGKALDDLKDARLVIAQQAERIAMLEERLIDQPERPPERDTAQAKILGLLADGEKRVSVLLEGSGITLNSLHTTLWKLRQAGKVVSRKEGRLAWYRLVE